MYQNWDEEQFREKIHIFKCNFDHVESIIRIFIEKAPTNLVPDPRKPEKQYALPIYRLVHGCSFAVISDQFGESKALAIETFNHVIRELLAYFYNDYVKMPENEDEWKEGLKGFIENYEFPCVGTWDGFHVYIDQNIKVSINSNTDIQFLIWLLLAITNGFWIQQLEHQHSRCSFFETYRIVPKDNGRSGASKQNSCISNRGRFCISKALLAG